MNISNYLETALLNAVFRNTPYTSPAKVYIALYTADPTDEDTGTEVSGGGYARQEIEFSAPTQVAGKGTIENTEDIVFPIASGDWGNVTHVGVRDAATGGNLLYFGPLENPRMILANDRARFHAGEFVLDLA